ncbi:MAG: hypothetical protein WBH85_16365 [Thermoanaerobaculia bacterium]
MAKRPSPKDRSADKGRKKQLMVVSSSGGRQRFLRGMITHSLMQRGLEFDDAYAMARAIRDRLADREEVSTTELQDLIQQQLEETLGSEHSTSLRAPARPISDLRVVDHGREVPFSRGLLARSLQAAGIDIDRAYRLVTELEGELRSEGVSSLARAEVARRVGDLLEAVEGKGEARRYRMMRRIQNLPRPLVIYIGGASGTGKSTLAVELAPLLRIYRINATDTIRQVMRMVFTPSILPALHSSSFEVAGAPEHREERPGSPSDPEFVERLISTYEEQATRVCVGIRAVVERASAENMSIVVEGVHAHPGMIPFADMEGVVYQVPLVMATLDEEAHRSRFLTRARAGGRRAERYLENFEAIRVIHDHILQQAELHDRPLLDTSHGDLPVVPSLRIVTSVLEKGLPSPGLSADPETRPEAPTLLLIIDGLADRPVRALGGRTPLQAADTPTLDRLAKEGRCGLADPVAPGVVPDTAAGSLALFGQSPLALKRGPVEALGADITLSPTDVALRGNLATLDDDGRVIDRRAGRIREEASELAQALDLISLPPGLNQDVTVRVSVGTEHRLAIVLLGDGLSSAITGSDPGEGAPLGPPLVPSPLDPEDEQATYTAGALALWEQEARKMLADHPVNQARAEQGLPVANAVLTRGAGRIHRLIPLEEDGAPLRLTCIGGDHTLLGLARWVGARTVTSDAMTANLDTDLEAKFKAAEEALHLDDLVILHLKGADIAAHDQRPDLKALFLEQLDRQLARLLEEHKGPLRVAVASDHATLSESGQHAADPLPVLIWGEGIDPDGVEAFDEQSARGGGLQRFPLQMLLGRLFKLN